MQDGQRWGGLSEMAHVSDLFIAIERHKPMKRVEQAMAVADRGFDGCVHGRSGGKRQVLLVDGEALAEFGLTPGALRENITTTGLDLAALGAGHRLFIGNAVLEVTIPCEPCHRMDEIRMGLQDALKDRRGVLCRVIEGGRISRGDAIEVERVAETIPYPGGAR
jgi:MOSC domain-containing protein YiiM